MISTTQFTSMHVAYKDDDAHFKRPCLIDLEEIMEKIGAPVLAFWLFGLVTLMHITLCGEAG